MIMRYVLASLTMSVRCILKDHSFRGEDTAAGGISGAGRVRKLVFSLLKDSASMGASSTRGVSTGVAVRVGALDSGLECFRTMGKGALLIDDTRARERRMGSN